jgi:glycine cleavage system H protein
MPSPVDCLYSESHEWHKVSGDAVTIGLTKFAVDQLTDVTYVQLKPKGTKVQPGGGIGEVESVKTTSDVYSAVAGEIVEVNQAVVDDPSLINQDCYGKAWLVKVRMADRAGLEKLMKPADYDKAYPA